VTVAAPTILAQITDPHIRLDDDGTSASLSSAVEALAALDTPADAVIVTGDLVDEPGRAEYALVQECLAPIAVPTYVLMGNHDDRDALRAAFPLNGAGPVPSYRYSVRVGGLRLIGLDTTVPGRVGGALGDEEIAWLAAELAAEPDVPTMIAMHHPPFDTGNDAIDTIGLEPSGRERLASVLERHPQVRRVICGHVHATTFETLAGCPVMACAATRLQLPFQIPGGEELELVSEPGAIALHVLMDGSLKTHVRALGG